MPYFVYVKGLKGPSPQVWYVHSGDISIWPHLQATEITKEEAKLPISELEKKYPPPQLPQD